MMISDGKIALGSAKYPDRKRPSLVVNKGNEAYVYGYFYGEGKADEFMKILADFVGAKESAGDGDS